MIETLKSLQPLIITALVVFALILFRKQVCKLVDWIVSFRRFSKTKNGYQASAEPEPRGLLPEPKEGLTEEAVVKTIEVTKQQEEGKEEKGSWIKALFFEKNYDKAIELLKEKLEEETDAKERASLKGFIGYSKFMKDNKTGVEYFEDVIREHEANSNTYYWYAICYYDQEDYNATITIAKRGVDEFEEASPSLYELYAECLVRLNRKIEAIGFLEEALKRYPERPSHYIKIADILIGLGIKDLARDCCKVGITFCPKDVALLEKYAGIATEMGQYDEGMAIYLKLTNLKPDEPRYWGLLGNQYLQLQFNDLALEAYKTGNQLASEKQAWIIGNIGNLMKNRGFNTDGASWFQKALAIDPNSQFSHERLAEALKSSQQEKEKRDKTAEEVQRQLVVYSGRLDEVIKLAKERQGSVNSLIKKA